MKNDEDKLIVAKLLDKIEQCKKQNKITYTNFLDVYQQQLVRKTLNEIKCNNYLFYGGYENSERNIVCFYPDKLKGLEENIIKKNIKIVRVELSKESYGLLNHRDYLGAAIKIGINREKIGDILVEDKGADVIVMLEISEFVKDTFKELKRFTKSDIKVLDIENIRSVEVKKQEIEIIVASLRLDNIIAELARVSRNKADELIKQERVFINSELQNKNSKQVKENDKITIRGKGKFEINKVQGTTRSGRTIVLVQKYV